MSTWRTTARPTRRYVEEHGKAFIEYMANAQLQCLAARKGQVLDHITYDWWEDGTLRSSASGRPSGAAWTEE